MENQNSSNHNRRTLRRNSNSHISMSDTESTSSQVDYWHSPDPVFLPENDNLGNKSCKSLVPSTERHYSPVPSPGKSNFTATSPAAAAAEGRRRWPHSEKPTSGNGDIPASPAGKAGGRREISPPENQEFGGRGNSPVILGLNRLVKEEAPRGVKKVGAVGGVAAVEEGYGGGGNEVGEDRRSSAEMENILRRSERGGEVTKWALVVRVFEVIACLISFSVMAADKTKGWSGDSFDRYREYRFCLVVNIIGFVYSGFQAYDLAYHLGTEKHVISHHLRYHFDFSMDQILAYLLMSASSSAATRVTDWITNWGRDEFTLMASASIAMSFLAFVAFAASSLISGYNLCDRDST